MAQLGGKTVFTLKQWCITNGYPGVTNECILSAEGSSNERIKKLAKKERIHNIIGR